MRKTLLSAVLSVFALGVLVAVHADDDHGKAKVVHFSARLDGFQEVGALNNETGAIHTAGQGSVKLTLHRDTDTIDYLLTYSGLTSPVQQAHIHFGRVHVPGGVMVFFCSNLTGAPAGTQACPSAGGTVTGSWTASTVRPIAGQTIAAGDFDALVDALTSRSAYANVHTNSFTAGEIRGQVLQNNGNGKD
jgi:hypothetical protein